jgi:KRAB domain-containing zinc finger protein
LTSHKLVHTEVGRLMLHCRFCAKILGTKAILQSHEKACLKNKNRQLLSCKFCDKKFGHKGYLKEHEMLHQNPDAFRCDICGHRSTTLGNLRIHKKKNHMYSKLK